MGNRVINRVTIRIQTTLEIHSKYPIKTEGARIQTEDKHTRAAVVVVLGELNGIEGAAETADCLLLFGSNDPPWTKLYR